ncbi:hypothetical protein [Streptococcus parauberis]
MNQFQQLAETGMSSKEAIIKWRNARDNINKLMCEEEDETTKAIDREW